MNCLTSRVEITHQIAQRPEGVMASHGGPGQKKESTNHKHTHILNAKCYGAMRQRRVVRRRRRDEMRRRWRFKRGRCVTGEEERDGNPPRQGETHAYLYSLIHADTRPSHTHTHTHNRSTCKDTQHKHMCTQALQEMKL